MVAVNELLALDIKFHLLTTIKLDLDKIRTFIRRDMAWFVRDLNALALKLSMTTSEQVHLKFQPRGVQFG